MELWGFASQITVFTECTQCVHSMRIVCSQCAHSVGHTLRRTITDVRRFRPEDGLNAQSVRLLEQAEAVSQDAYSTLQISLQCFILLPPGDGVAQQM